MLVSTMVVEGDFVIDEGLISRRKRSSWWMWVEEDHESFVDAITIRGVMNATRREKRQGPSFWW